MYAHLYCLVMFDIDPGYASGTGEHGVGIGKKKYLVEELGEDTVELMKTVKRAIDPLNLFNPGKVCLLECIRRWADRLWQVVSGGW